MKYKKTFSSDTGECTKKKSINWQAYNLSFLLSKSWEVDNLVYYREYLNILSFPALIGWSYMG